MGRLVNTYPEMMKKIMTAKWPPDQKSRSTGTAAGVALRNPALDVAAAPGVALARAGSPLRLRRCPRP